MSILGEHSNGVWFWAGAVACPASLLLCGVDLAYLAPFAPMAVVAWILRRHEARRNRHQVLAARSCAVAVLWSIVTIVALAITTCTAMATPSVTWTHIAPPIVAAVWLAGFYLIDLKRLRHRRYQ